jgi:hypothetical protein
MAIISLWSSPPFPLVWLDAVGRVELVAADVAEVLCVVGGEREDVGTSMDASEVDVEGSVDVDDVEDEVGGADEIGGVDTASCSGT